MCSQLSGEVWAKQFVRHRLAGSAHVVEGVGQIGRVPVDDGRDDQVEARCAKLLRVLPRSAMRPCLKVQITCASAWRCSLLFRPAWQSCRSCGDFQPVQHEQRSLDASKFLQREIKLVLTLVGRQPLQHG